MAAIWSLVWGLLAAAVMIFTKKYYLPQLTERIHVSESQSPARVDNDETNSGEECSPCKDKYLNGICGKRAYRYLLLAVCVCFMARCGYTAAAHAISAVSIVKMTLAMSVLSCIFVTDLELMIIPNVCSVILIAGRLLTVIYEFVWMRNEAMAWLLNSVVAFAISFLFLFLMSKLTRGGLGMGDVKIFSSLGFLCGIRAVCFTLTFSFIFCALISTCLLVIKKKHMKDSLSMGPFIWLGYGVTVLLSII